jgi:hypothetical protein
MSERRADRRRAENRAFRPTVDGQLEDRKLMTVHTFIYPPFHIQTAHNGSAVDITTPQGQSFYISLTNKNELGNVGAGTIKAFYMGGGKFGLTLYGTSLASDLTINPVIDHRFQGTAHKYNSKQANYTNLINIGAITVANGTIGDIEGYKTAILSGPLIATANTPIDRIAFDEITAGASILTGGDVNTIDVFDSVFLSGANTGFSIGRDLNWFNAPGNVTLANGANIVLGRDLGLALQPAKGTGIGGQGFSVQGNITINVGSVFKITRFIDAPITASGSIVGASRITATATNVVPPGNTIVGAGGVFA